MIYSVLDWLDFSSIRYGDKVLFNDVNNTLTFNKFNTITKSVGTYLSKYTAPEKPVVVMSGVRI